MKQPSSNAKERSAAGVQSVDRALEVLAAVCEADGGIALRDLSEQLGLHKSTVYRLLQTLSTHRFVVQDPVTKQYRAGLRLFELANLVIAKIEVRTQALPELKALSQQTNETVHLAVLDEGDVVYIDKQETQRTIRMYSAIGKRAPVHCTALGKVLLAYLPEAEIERIAREKGLKPFTERTITSLQELKRHLAMVREKGYAIDDMEHEPDIRCAACPIRDHTGKVIAAVSLTVPAMRASREQLEAMAPLVKQTADRISRKMGYVPDISPAQEQPIEASAYQQA